MRLLESLCDTIDGSLTYIAFIACFLLKYSLTKSTPETISTDY